MECCTAHIYGCSDGDDRLEIDPVVMSLGFRLSLRWMTEIEDCLDIVLSKARGEVEH